MQLHHRVTKEQRKKEIKIGSDIACLVTAIVLVCCSMSNVAGRVTKFQNGFIRIGGIGGEIDTCQFRKHLVKSPSLFHFTLVTDNLHNSRGSQHEISGAMGGQNYNGYPFCGMGSDTDAKGWSHSEAHL